MCHTGAVTDYRVEARIFHALGQPVRLIIADLLLNAGSDGMATGEVFDAAPFKVSHQMVSYHLGVLHRAGLVSRQREGQFTVYRINEEVWAACGASMAGRLKK